MNKFQIIFKDLLAEKIKVVGQVEAKCVAEVVEKFGLIKMTESHINGYWDGRNGGVVIYIDEVRDNLIADQKTLNKLVNHWYEIFD